DDPGHPIVIDGPGNAYVTGETNSTDFPTTPGAVQPTNAGGFDAYVAKLNPTGSRLLYATYLGGSTDDLGNGIAVDGLRNAYITGQTTSTDFPTSSGAVQPTKAGGTDAFVTRLNAAGNRLLYSTYLGGSLDEFGFDIAVDNSGDAY